MNDPLCYQVIGCVLEVYKTLGPGLLESIYEKALMEELCIQGLTAENQVTVPINYKGKNLGEGLKIDILVADKLVLELKSVEELKPVHFKQLQTYLKLTNLDVGLLINFNESDLMKGIHRIVNKHRV